MKAVRLFIVVVIGSIMSIAAVNGAELAQEQHAQGGSFLANIQAYTEREYTTTPLPEKGYNVIEVADGYYYIHDVFYNTGFIVTGEGVIVIDAPEFISLDPTGTAPPEPSLAEYIVEAVKEITDQPITHVIYSHHHIDHIGGAHLYPDNAVYIAHEKTAELLREAADPNRPIPTVTFDDTYELTVGNTTLQLFNLGRSWHSQQDIVIWSPRHKVLEVIDYFHQDAAPWLNFAESRDAIFNFAVADILLEKFDFEIFISGHERIVGTRKHLEQHRDFLKDMQVAVMQAFQTINIPEIRARYTESSTHAWFLAILNAVSEECSTTMQAQWRGKIRNVDLLMFENCRTMVMYLGLESPGRPPGKP